MRKARRTSLYAAGEVAMTLSRGRAADLYQQHARDAIRLAYLLTGDSYLAEDVTQDAFVRLFGRFQELRKPDAFAFYLRRTVVNLVRDHFRRQKRERAFSRNQRTGNGEEDAALVRVDALDELLCALQSLPPRQRAAVVLRYCEGMSEQDAADVMGASVGAVNSLVSRGLKTLRTQVRREENA